MMCECLSFPSAVGPVCNPERDAAYTGVKEFPCYFTELQQTAGRLGQVSGAGGRASLTVLAGRVPAICASTVEVDGRDTPGQDGKGGQPVPTYLRFAVAIEQFDPPVEPHGRSTHRCPDCGQ